MNLHGIASGIIAAVNPMVPAVLRVCTGYTTASSGGRTPTYAADVPMQAQVQDLSQRDINHLDSLNIQGSQKVIYLKGELSGLIRAGGKGGDLVLLGDPDQGPQTMWLVTSVMEQWPDWARVSVTLQNGA